MYKFLAVVRHEYKKVVLKWSFVIGTLLLPFLAACFAIVPMIIFSFKGEPTRIAVADPTGKLLPRIEQNLSADRLTEKAQKAARDSMVKLDATQEEKMRNNAAMFMKDFALLKVPQSESVSADLRANLLNRILAGEIDAFLIIPENFGSADARFEYRSRKGADFISNDTFKDAVNDAVRSQRLADANISEEKLSELSSAVNFDAKGIDEAGEDRDNEGIWVASFAIGLMIYLTLAIYGQAIMGAVVEEKETRIAEYSSRRPGRLN
jgi:ABC-type Na+ efflux pump permease subunit